MEGAVVLIVIFFWLGLVDQDWAERGWQAGLYTLVMPFVVIGGAWGLIWLGITFIGIH